MDLGDSVSVLKGVGDEAAKKLAILNVHTISDLIEYFPRRYDDYSNVLSIKKIKPGPVTIRAKIKQASGRYATRGMHITEAVASDETDSVRLIWFNQPYRPDSIKKDAEYFISGNFELSHKRLSIMNPSIELVGEFPLNTARIVPVYRETRGLKSFAIRKLVKQLVPYIDKLPETLPAWLIAELKLMSRPQALLNLHFPSSTDQLDEAKKRMGFEEVFYLSLASAYNKQEVLSEKSIHVPFEVALARSFVEKLPFKLTDAQRKVIWQIYKDMEKPHPMNRLVEGDVGSGKTVVAAMAAVMAMQSGFQVALMAPTELLAKQHAESLFEMLEPLGKSEKLSLLTGSMKADQKKRAQTGVKNHDISLIVGTHSLIQQKVDMHKLALVIIDEQHRFGVEQRKALIKKAGHMPHVLTMTATPIPRSLALTLYGEMDVSIIDSLPPGRKPVKTSIVSPNSRKQLYEKIDSDLAKGRQMFVVCPLIEDSEVINAASAQKIYDDLSKRIFKHRQVGLLHGKMKADQKESVMKKFVEGKIDILVSTTVIEVGVDVPNAAIMLIESADRFGLAQIHQLRGRVGRGSEQGYCYLVMSDSLAPPRRLRLLEQSTNGFELADLDLEMRGPGAIYGTMQHGQLDLKIASLTDYHLIAQARKAAKEFIERGENLVHYKYLQKKVTSLRAVTNLN